MLYKLSREHFLRHLESIHRAGARVFTIDRVPPASSKPWPVLLTFDDGALSSYSSVAGDLEAHGWRGHFFITTDWIGRPGFLNAQQIRELDARGHIIGSHTCSHPSRMSKLSWNDLLREWSASCAVLSGILGRPVEIASVADGYYSRKVGRAAAASGIRILFTSEPRATAFEVDQCRIVGRYAVQRQTPEAVSGAIAAGNFWPRFEQTLLWNARKPVKALAGDSYFKMRRALLSRTGRGWSYE
jgi:peptidoglycan/xylan/chitin deacetylase (PgdA/CDA1 family)